jgi:hypothetical protein
METGIHIDGTANVATADAVGNNIALIFKAGFETRQSEACIIQALMILGDATRNSPTSIMNCDFGDTIKRQ